jgi:hypothetical protein
MTHSKVTGLSILPHNDVHFDINGDLVMVHDAEAIGQHIRQRLKFWRGETSWWYGEDVGVEWTKYLLGRPPQEQSVAEAVIKQEVLTTPGVTKITEFDAYYDRKNRGLIVSKLVVETEFEDHDHDRTVTVLPAPVVEPPPPIPPPEPPPQVVVVFEFETPEESQYVAVVAGI